LVWGLTGPKWAEHPDAMKLLNPAQPKSIGPDQGEMNAAKRFRTAIPPHAIQELAF
jgi:hypothetical protein